MKHCVSLVPQPAAWDQLLFAELRSGFLFLAALIDCFLRYYMGKKRSLQNGDIDCSDSAQLLLFFLIKIWLSWRNLLLMKIALGCYQTKLWCPTLEKTTNKRWPSRTHFLRHSGMSWYTRNDGPQLPIETNRSFKKVHFYYSHTEEWKEEPWELCCSFESGRRTVNHMPWILCKIFHWSQSFGQLSIILFWTSKLH